MTEQEKELIELRAWGKEFSALMLVNIDSMLEAIKLNRYDLVEGMLTRSKDIFTQTNINRAAVIKFDFDAKIYKEMEQ